MKNIAFTLIFYAVLGGFTWLGFDQGVAGAANVVMFAIWGGLLPIAVLTAIGSMDEESAIKVASKPKLPRWALFVTRCVRWYCLAVLVWQGAWATGIAFALFMLGVAIAHKAIDEQREKLAAEALAKAVAQGA